MYTPFFNGRMKSFEPYINLLTLEHKYKYNTLLKEYNDSCKDYDEKFETYKDVVDKKCALPGYQEFVEWWQAVDYNNNINEYRTRLAAFEQQIPNYSLIFNQYNSAADRKNQAQNNLKRFRSAVYVLYEIPKPTATKTDDVTKQCAICMENLKDYSLPCGHLYCIECVEKIKKCSVCKKQFMSKDVRKIYY